MRQNVRQNSVTIWVYVKNRSPAAQDGAAMFLQ